MNDNKGNPAVLAAVMATALITTFMGNALNLSIPEIESTFHVNAATVNAVMSAYTITVAALSLPFGKIADSRGRRKVFLTGITGFGLMSVLNAFSVNFLMFIIVRVLQGMFAAMMFSTNNAILISSYPPSQRGKVLGLSVAATYIGLTLGPVVGGFLQSSFGWRSIFAVSAMIALAALIIAIKGVPVDERAKQSLTEGSDAAGPILYPLSIILTLLGLTYLTAAKLSPVILLAGLVLLVLFFKLEQKTSNPVLRTSLFTGSRTFTFSNLAALLNYGSTYAITYMMSIYLQLVKGFAPDKAGLILISMPLMQALFSPLMGSLSDRVRPAILASGGMGLCAASLLMLSRVSQDTPLAYIMVPLLLTGLGFGMFSSPNNNLIMSCVEPKDYSVANSIIATMRTCGQATGLAVLNIITGALLGKSTLESAGAERIVALDRTSFLIFSAICIAGLFFSLARDKRS